MTKNQPGRVVTEAGIAEFAAKTNTPIKKVRGPECASCGAFIPLDEVTLGIPQRIPGGTHALVPAYDLTPILKCSNCGHEADYPVSGLQTRLL